MPLQQLNSALNRGVAPALFAAACVPLFASMALGQGKGDAALKRRLFIEAVELVSAYTDQDRRTLGNAMVERFLAQKDPESAAELVVGIDLRDGWIFSRIAQTFLDRGDLRRAVSVASLPRDSAARNDAFANLAAAAFSRLGVNGASEVIASIADSSTQLNSVLRVAQHTYYHTPAVVPLLREWWPRALADTTVQGRQRAGQLAGALLMQRDKSGLQALAALPIERNLYFYNVSNAANSLRSRGDPFADSVSALALEIIRTEADPRKRAQLEQNFRQRFSPPGSDLHWRRTVDSLNPLEAKRSYLNSVANRRMQEGDTRTSEEIADLLFQLGDTNTARSVLFNVASSLGYGYWNNQTTPLAVALRIVQRIIDTGKPDNPAVDHFAVSARALLPRLSIEHARRLAEDPTFPQMEAQVQESTINALMSVDLQAGLALALMLTDSARTTSHLRNGAERLISAGMTEAGLSIVARIPVASQRVGPLARVMQVKLQNGDTTGVRSMLAEVMNVMDLRQDNYQFNEMIVPSALRMGMKEEMLEWAKRLPFETRAFVVVALWAKL